MAAWGETLKAETKVALRKKVTQWTKKAKKSGLTIQAGWEPERIKETPKGYEVYVRAHY